VSLAADVAVVVTALESKLSGDDDDDVNEGDSFDIMAAVVALDMAVVLVE